MDKIIKEAIFKAISEEPFARALNMELIALDDGYSVAEMTYVPSTMNNIYSRAHGGAIFSLIDAAFETVSQTDGTIGIALNVSVTFIESPQEGATLRAEAREAGKSKKIANYDIKVVDQDNQLIATCQAMAYRTRKPLPFL